MERRQNQTRNENIVLNVRLRGFAQKASVRIPDCRRVDRTNTIMALQTMKNHWMTSDICLMNSYDINASILPSHSVQLTTEIIEHRKELQKNICKICRALSPVKNRLRAAFIFQEYGLFKSSLVADNQIANPWPVGLLYSKCKCKCKTWTQRTWISL